MRKQVSPKKNIVTTIIVRWPYLSIRRPMYVKVALPINVPNRYSVLTVERLISRSVIKCSIKMETPKVCPGVVIIIAKVAVTIITHP